MPAQAYREDPRAMGRCRVAGAGSPVTVVGRWRSWPWVAVGGRGRGWPPLRPERSRGEWWSALRSGLCLRSGPTNQVVSCGRSGEWRNRQTRRIQVPVSERTWGFKSPLAHHGFFAKLVRSARETLVRGRSGSRWRGCGSISGRRWQVLAPAELTSWHEAQSLPSPSAPKPFVGPESA